MSYQYVTYNERGEVVRGRVSTRDIDLDDLINTSRRDKLGIRTLLASPIVQKLSARFHRIKPSEIVLFYRQLALLIESGIDIITALSLLRSQSTNSTFIRVLEKITTDLQSGSQLSVAMAKHKDIFPPICCQSLRVGEQTGNMEVMLRQVADYTEKSNITTKNVKGALMLPMITAVVAFIVIGVLVLVVLPAFNNLYASMGASLPALTRNILSMSGALQNYGLYIVLSFLIIVAVAYAYIRTPAGKYHWDGWMLKMPVMGRINRLNELARACRSISLLFKAGLPLTEILPLVIQGSRNTVMTESLSLVNEDMLKGEGLSQPMAKRPIFLPMMVQMVKVGEETGNLDTTLLSVAQNYETEAEDRTKTMISLIQPAMTLVIGGVVGLIALSLVSAMYSIYGQIG